MTPIAPPTEREAQITRLVGTPAEKQRVLLSLGWRFDLFGIAYLPKREVAA